MKIAIWSDIVCPFCYIGKRKLEAALAEFPHREQVEIEFKSFELDPNAPLKSDMTMHEALASKYGMTVEQAKQNMENLALQAADAGLAFNFDGVKPANTFNGHRLIKWAKTMGKEEEMIERLYKAYFTDVQDVGSTEVLASLAEEAGLSRKEAGQVLADESAFAEEVREDEAEARKFGIQGVPFFIFNNKYAVSGAQPEEVFSGALHKVWEEEHPKPNFEMLNDGENTVCGEDGCIVPPREQ